MLNQQNKKGYLYLFSNHDIQFISNIILPEIEKNVKIKLKCVGLDLVSALS